MIVTTETIQGKNILETKGLVSGTIVLSKNVFTDFGAGLKTIVGGELVGYTKLQEEARQKAMSRMVENAKGLGANAVVGVRMTSSSIMQGASEIVVFGTAVVVE